MKHLKILFLLISVSLYSQQGGMWIPSLLQGQNEKEMKSLGIKLSAKDIYDANKSSLKDAIPQFGGCSSGMISDQGLLLTNHHCGYGQIQTHSSVEKDYLANGFWAYSLSEELPNKNTTATFIIRIDDVTKAVLQGTEGVSLEEKNSRIQKNISEITKNSPKESWQENRVRAFYNGNQYLLFVVEVFKDVRLVGAPPSSIGKFGSDTDNWAWPRHTGDFTLFRIYADKNNRPAEYSKDNVPYKPKNFLKISLAGIKENDPTLILGYPGRTEEYLPSIAVEQLVKTINPAKIEIREEALKVQGNYMRQDNAIKIQYAAKNAQIANYWKKWKGESLGLIRMNAVEKIREREAQFTKKVAQSGKTAYQNLLPDFQKYYTEFEKYDLAVTIFDEVTRNIGLFDNGFKLYQLKNIYQTRGEQSFTDRKNNLLKSFEASYKDYNSLVDKDIFSEVMKVYAKRMPKEFVPANFSQLADAEAIYLQSALTSYKGVEALLSGSASEVLAKMENDKGLQLISKLFDVFYSDIVPKYNLLNSQIQELQSVYMKAILEFSRPEDRIFPDANSTLRATYGKIKGYSPSDGIQYEPITYLEGVMEKYVPADYEFDVPEKLRNLFNEKNYGIYADKNGKLPVCFLGTNHTTGGNSGSSVVDARGNLIGLNFDRVWEGTMSDIYYDPAICRNIMVDIRYVLFIIDKYANAQNLIKEMKIIPPKK